MVIQLVVLIAICLGALGFVTIRALWKYTHVSIPKVAKGKTWPLYVISIIHVVVILAIFVVLVLYFVANSSNSAGNLENVQKIVKEFDAHVEISKRTLSNVQNIQTSSIAGGDQIYNDFTGDINEKSGLKNFRTERNRLEDYSQFLLDLKNDPTCGTSDGNLDKMNKQMEEIVFCTGNVTATAGDISDNYIGLQASLKNVTKNHMNELTEETKRITNHLASTTSMLQNIASSFTESSKLVEQNTSAVGNMSDFIPICLSTLFAIIFAALCVFANIKYRNLALPSPFSLVLMAGFYILLAVVIVLSGFQAFLSLASSAVCTEKPVALLSFTTESYKNNNTVNVNEILVSCSSAKKKFFSTHESPISTAKSVFIRNYREKFVEKTAEAFDPKGSFDKDILAKRIQDAQELKTMLDELLNKCTGAATQSKVPTYQTALIETEKYLKNAQEFGEKLNTIKDIATAEIDKALESTKVVVSKPIDEINQALTESDFDCRQTVETFSTGLNSCKHGNSSAKFRFKFAILLCSVLCAFMYLMALRRTDMTQYGNDTRRKWALSQISKVHELNREKQEAEFAALKPKDKSAKEGFAVFEKYKNDGTIRRDNRKCWDKTRVVLKNRESDFIYASWVEIPNCPRKYIVTQEPLEKTTSDFWAMCCQENVNIILELSDEEKEDVKTYFPANLHATKIAGSLHITCTERKANPFKTVNWRVFKVQDTGKKDSSPLFINHIHVLWWPEETTPWSLYWIVDLYSLVNSENKMNSPICVHSEHGFGRAGTYVYFDYAYSQICKNKENDLYQYLKELRQMKYDAVEYAEQLEYVKCGLMELIIRGGIVDRSEATKFFEAYKTVFRINSDSPDYE